MFSRSRSLFAAHHGSFAGKQLFAHTYWHTAKMLTFFLICAMLANKTFQGNIWGIPNREEGIVPVQQFLLGKPTDKFIDTVIRNGLDTQGFVGDNQEIRNDPVKKFN